MRSRIRSAFTLAVLLALAIGWPLAAVAGTTLWPSMDDDSDEIFPFKTKQVTTIVEPQGAYTLKKVSVVRFCPQSDGGHGNDDSDSNSDGDSDVRPCHFCQPGEFQYKYRLKNKKSSFIPVRRFRIETKADGSVPITAAGTIDRLNGVNAGSFDGGGAFQNGVATILTGPIYGVTWDFDPGPNPSDFTGYLEPKKKSDPMFVCSPFAPDMITVSTLGTFELTANGDCLGPAVDCGCPNDQDSDTDGDSDSDTGSQGDADSASDDDSDSTHVVNCGPGSSGDSDSDGSTDHAADSDSNSDFDFEMCPALFDEGEEADSDSDSDSD